MRLEFYADKQLLAKQPDKVEKKVVVVIEMGAPAHCNIRYQETLAFDV